MRGYVSQDVSVVEPISESHVPLWRVVLVRLPPGGSQALQPVLPRDRPISADELPLVLRVASDAAVADETARRLRLVGAVVAVLEESTPGDHSPFCVDHPTGLAARSCVGCGRAICPTCALLAGGASRCARCAEAARRLSERVRRRQLLMVLAFCVFLYGVTTWIRADQGKVSPDGPVAVGVFQLVPPGEAHASIVATLNGRGEPGTPKLRDIAAWYDAEHQRYTGRAGPFLQMTVRGPWAEALSPPALGRPEDPWWRLMLQSWRSVHYFRGLVHDRGVDPDAYGVKVYVVYSRSKADLASESRGSERGHVAIAYIDLDEKNPAYALLTVAHEIGHTLGAEDLYDPDTGLSHLPTGFVEPMADPLYPQRYAELMAVDRPTGPRTEVEIQSLDEVRIGYHSASLMGWIGEEQADWFYDPPSTAPAEALERAAPASVGEPSAPRSGP